jgi:hypothetical protein
MKKIILGLLLTGACYNLMAQTPVYTASEKEYVMPATTVYSSPTVIVPVYTEQSFRMQYPRANRTAWYRLNDDWWRVSYINDGPYETLVYPVLENAVPSNVVDNIVDKFGSLYDITETTGSNYQTQYLVRMLDANGQLKTITVNASGNEVPY